MLALARGEGQSIIINGTIEVKVVKWSRSAVRLAIQAPREVTVDREEIWRRMNPGQPTPLEKAELERAARPPLLTLVGSTAGSVRLSWTGSATQTGFELDRANDAAFTQGVITLNLPASPFFHTDTEAGLAPGGTFYYRIRATTPSGTTPSSEPVAVKVPPHSGTA